MQKKLSILKVLMWIIVLPLLPGLGSQGIFAQTVPQVNMQVSVVVTPPYSTDLYNYSNQTRVIITTNFSTRGTLDITIKGNNGIVLKTAGNIELPLLSFGAGQMNQFTGIDLSPYFDYYRMTIKGSTVDKLQDGGLPEGNYQICVRVKSPDGIYLSSEAPSGCSNHFTIRYSDPPTPINPLCGTTLSHSPVQNVVFSWTPATGAPAWTQYTLKIVELLDSTQNPNAAMLSATDPAFFETEVTGAFSFLYGPAQPLLEKGKYYAWQVIAEERETQTRFANNGKSPVCWFKWDPVQMPVFTATQTEPEITKKPQNKVKITQVTNVDPVPISVVSGNLNYKFKGDGGGTASMQLNQTGVSMIGDGLNYNQNNISASGSKPLANVKVSLIMTYILKGKIDNKPYNGEPVNTNELTNLSSFNSSFPGNDQILATTTTGPDGNFSFTFMNTEQNLGLVNGNVDWRSNSGDFYDQIQGRIYKVYRLRVENQYYCSPDINIKLKPWESLDLGNIVSYVKSYDLKVHTKWTSSTFYDIADGQGTDMSEVKTSLIRKTHINDVPGTEGGYPAASGGGPLQILPMYPLSLKTDYSDGSGTVLFKNLVQHNPDNNQDRYYFKCEPDKHKGMHIFKKKERSFYPLYLKDKGNFPFNSTRQETPTNVPSGQLAVPVSYGENITWNSQLQVKTYEMTMELYPDDPRIYGQVQAEDVKAKPMSNVTLILVSAYQETVNFGGIIRTAKTDSKGYFEFNNLDMELGTFNLEGPTSVLGPVRTLLCSPKGFKEVKSPLGILKWGQQVEKNYFMEPDGLLTGYVVDDKGKAVAADIQVDDLAFDETHIQLEYNQSGNQSSDGSMQMMTMTPSGLKQVFNIKAPSGNNRTLRIIPKDPGYTEETYTVNVPKESSASQELKPYVVYKMMKRIRFMIAEKPTTNMYNVANLKPVPYAEVILNLGAGSITKSADARGFVNFEFENNQNSFTFKINSPEEADLENGTYTINNVPDSKTLVVYPSALLKKATRISGKVTMGGDKNGLPNATVYYEKGNGERIQTTTNQFGDYVLKKIPTDPSNITVWASKPGEVPNITSQSKSITLKKVNQLNFELHLDNEIIIDNIFGFKADIQEKTKLDDDSYKVSGCLIELPPNPNFKLADETKTIPFTDLKIQKRGVDQKSGVPIGVPADKSFDTDISELSLIANGAYNIIQKPSSGTLLKVSVDNNYGQIRGKAGIMKSSFQYSENYLAFKDDSPLFITESPGSTETNIVTLTTNDYPSKKWGVCGQNNSNIEFTYQDFNAVADKTKSSLDGDKINLFTTLNTNEITGMTPSKLSVVIGDLSLHPNKIDPVSNSNPLSFKLEKWDVKSTGWSINQTQKGIYMPTGTIKTGLVDVPVKNMVITTDNFDVEKFDIDNVSFSGVVPLNIKTQNRSFGYNPSSGSDMKGHWELRIVGLEGEPGVMVSGLPGMQPGAELKFQTFSLFSNGEQKINMGNQEQELVFYDILKVKPVSFSGGDKYFDMGCTIDLDIPRIKPATGVIRFSKPAGTVNFNIYPINISFDGLGGIQFISGIAQGNQQLNSSGFTATGTIKDPEGINLKAKLHRTKTATWIEVDPSGQKMPLGSDVTSLNNIEGKMEVLPNANDWSKFTFSGEMTGFKGMASDTRKTFTVHGSITAENESLGVKNIPGPFGGMNITYDLKNARLIGNMDVNKQMGPMRIAGAANILVSQDGWYFLLGGQLTSPGFGNMAAGMIIGDYRVMSPDITQTIMQFAYNKNIPSTLQSGVSGFFFTGQKDVPIINIPGYDIDLGVMSASLGLTAGLDGRVWMGFNSSGNEYGIGAMAFIHAWFSATSITCTKLSADARAELGAQGTYQTNTGAFTVSGCGSFTIGGSAKQCFPTPCWDGICCKGCIGGGVSKSIKLDMQFDSQGNTSLDFGIGNCSGQATMTSGW